MKKKIVNSIIISIIFIFIGWLGIEIYTDSNIKKGQAEKLEYNLQNVSAQYYNENKTKQYPKEEVVNEYKGYQVIARLEIPTINLETYILQKYSEETLNISVTKFWGADPNTEGNFCVAGHNFKNENMFRNLKKLEIGKRRQGRQTPRRPSRLPNDGIVCQDPSSFALMPSFCIQPSQELIKLSENWRIRYVFGY